MGHGAGSDATKVLIATKIPNRKSKEDDRTYLCFEETTPPWDEDLFFVKDDEGRNWFCYSSDIELTDQALKQLGEQVKSDYTPRDKNVLQRRLHSPLVIKIILCRASSLDELKDLINNAKI